MQEGANLGVVRQCVGQRQLILSAPCCPPKATVLKPSTMRTNTRRRMYYETDTNNHGLRYNPLKACVVPRPSAG